MTNIDLINTVIHRQETAGNEWALDHIAHMNRDELHRLAQAERRDTNTKAAA